MSETSVPQFQRKEPAPPGVLPKHTQRWILVGLAVVMITVMWLSPSPQPAPKRRPPGLPSAATVIDPNQARIQEYRARLDEEARKVAAEQAQVNQMKQSLGMSPHAAPSTLPSPPGQTSRTASYLPVAPDPERTALQVDRERREYLSRYASNVVDFRPRADPVDARKPAELSRPTPPSHGMSVPGERPGSATREAGMSDELHADFNRAEGKNYRLFEGTILETVLTNRLDGSFSGPVHCMVTTPVYSHNGQKLLVPEGTHVLGEVQRLESFGQQRLAVFFHRLIMPDGYSVSLDQFKGLNQIGETGLRDRVNHHYAQVFGVSLAIGSLAGLAQANTRSGFEASGSDAYRQGVSANLSQSSLRILDRYLNVLPSFTIREGHRVKVYLADDLLLPAYENHRMPSDL